MPIVVSSNLATQPGTVAALADRVYREYLHLGDDQPLIVTLDGAVDGAVTTWTLDLTAGIAPDELEVLGSGVVLETVDGEQVLVTGFAETESQVTVIRGYGGTEASAHPDGAHVIVAPVYGRQAVLDAVADNIVALYPALWATLTVEVETSSDPVEVPEGCLTPVGLLWSNGSGQWREARDLRLLDRFPPSATGKAILVADAAPGFTGYFTYRGRFDRPAATTTLLTELGLEPEWERIVVVGAAAQVVAGRDLDQLTSEYVTEQLERPGIRERVLFEAGEVFDGNIIFAEDLLEVPLGEISPEAIR